MDRGSYETLAARFWQAYPASAWTGDDYTEEEWYAQILHALDDTQIWGMVLTELDAWTADEMWGLVETIDIPPVSQSTRGAIRDRLAIDNRIPDNRFTHMPHASDGWLIHLIVDVSIILLIVAGYIIAPYVSSWLTAWKAARDAREMTELIQTIKHMLNTLSNMRGMANEFPHVPAVGV